MQVHVNLLIATAFLSLINGFIMPSDRNLDVKARRCTNLSLSNNKGPFGGFFQELDNFMDDAFSRRLGNGATFYGKRKSSFYGNDDKMKKEDAFMPDPTEDYQGPLTGNFKWKYDEESGQWNPVSVLKGAKVGRNPKYWDKVYEKLAEKEEQ